MKSTGGESLISCNRRGGSPPFWLKSSCSIRVLTGSREPSGAALVGQNVGQVSSLSEEKTRRLASDVVDRYVANVKIVETLARGYGFRPLFFWQPTIFNKTRLTAAERDEAQRYAWTEPAFRTVYERVGESSELKANPAFHDLSRIFVDENALVFIDYCHTTEAASAGSRTRSPRRCSC